MSHRPFIDRERSRSRDREMMHNRASNGGPGGRQPGGGPGGYYRERKPLGSAVKLHIARLSLDSKEEDLRNLFERFGKVEDVRIIRKTNNGAPLKEHYYGFVTMESREVSLHAMKALEPQGWDISFSRESQDHPRAQFDDRRRPGGRSKFDQGPESGYFGGGPNNVGGGRGYIPGGDRRMNGPGGDFRGESPRRGAGSRFGDSGFREHSPRRGGEMGFGDRRPRDFRGGPGDMDHDIHRRRPGNFRDGPGDMGPMHHGPGGMGGNPRREGRDPKNKVRELWVGNLDYNSTKEMLAAEFKSFGDIENIDIYQGKGQSYFAFIRFKRVTSASRAYESCNGMKIGGNQVKLAFADASRRQNIIGDASDVAPGDDMFREPEENRKRLYLKFTHPHIKASESSIRAAFEEFGVVRSVHLRASGHAKPFAFVEFYEEQAASAALKAMFFDDQRGERRHNLGDPNCEISIYRKVKKQENFSGPGDFDRFNDGGNRFGIGGGPQGRDRDGPNPGMGREHNRPFREEMGGGRQGPGFDHSQGRRDGGAPDMGDRREMSRFNNERQPIGNNGHPHPHHSGGMEGGNQPHMNRNGPYGGDYRDPRQATGNTGGAPDYRNHHNYNQGGNADFNNAHGGGQTPNLDRFGNPMGGGHGGSHPGGDHQGRGGPGGMQPGGGHQMGNSSYQGTGPQGGGGHGNANYGPRGGFSNDGGRDMRQEDRRPHGGQMHPGNNQGMGGNPRDSNINPNQDINYILGMMGGGGNNPGGNNPNSGSSMGNDNAAASSMNVPGSSMSAINSLLPSRGGASDQSSSGFSASSVDVNKIINILSKRGGAEETESHDASRTTDSNTYVIGGANSDPRLTKPDPSGRAVDGSADLNGGQYTIAEDRYNPMANRAGSFANSNQNTSGGQGANPGIQQNYSNYVQTGSNTTAMTTHTALGENQRSDQDQNKSNLAALGNILNNPDLPNIINKLSSEAGNVSSGSPDTNKDAPGTVQDGSGFSANKVIDLEATTPQVGQDEEEDEEDVIWSGFITRQKVNRVGVDAHPVWGDHEALSNEYNLNISHRIPFDDVTNRPCIGIVTFLPSNTTQEGTFNDYIEYFSSKQRAGVVNMKCGLMYLIPPCDTAAHYYHGTTEGRFIGIFVDANVEPEAGKSYDPPTLGKKN